MENGRLATIWVSIDMLGNTINACPDDLWTVRLWDDPEWLPSTEFWYLTYHTLFWLDLYLSGTVEGFVPFTPFNLDKSDPAGLLPEKVYTKSELLAYLAHNRQKCRATVDSLTAEKAQQLCKFPWGEVTFVSLLLDNMRHVQEHTAQLNLILGQKSVLAPAGLPGPMTKQKALPKTVHCLLATLHYHRREWMGVEPTAACSAQPATNFEDWGTHRGTTTPIS